MMIMNEYIPFILRTRYASANSFASAAVERRRFPRRTASGIQVRDEAVADWHGWICTPQPDIAWTGIDNEIFHRRNECVQRSLCW